jgi:protein involved in polysaccharide export with SLBB domain
MKRGWKALGWTLVWLGGCAGGPEKSALTPTALVQVSPASEEAALPENGKKYHLRSGDRLAVRVLTDNVFNSTAEIQVDGRVSIPWVGTVRASGRTLDALEKVVQDSLAYLLRRPVVTLGIDAFGPQRVYVTGEVRAPGAYPIEAGQTVLGAIIAAGGLLPTANTDDVLLLRRLTETEASVNTVDLEKILQGSRDFGDPVVQDLDIIHVPRTFIADVGIFVEQFFNRLRPIPNLYLDGWEAFHIDQVRTIRETRFVP